MAISTWSELKTAAASWLHRDGLTSRIEEFISLAENRIHYGSKDPQFPSEPLRVRAMQQRDTGSVSSGTISIPTGYLETIRLTLTVDGKNRALEYLPSAINAAYESETENANFFTVINGAIYVGAAGGGSGYVHDYYKALDALSGSNATNWLITNSPNAYLYGTLIEAMPFIGKDERLNVWYRMFAAAINGLNSQDKRDSYARGSLQVRAVS
jgi:hypothetical protein